MKSLYLRKLKNGYMIILNGNGDNGWEKEEYAFSTLQDAQNFITTHFQPE